MCCCKRKPNYIYILVVAFEHDLGTCTECRRCMEIITIFVEYAL